MRAVRSLSKPRSSGISARTSSAAIGCVGGRDAASRPIGASRRSTRWASRISRTAPAATSPWPSHPRGRTDDVMTSWAPRRRRRGQSARSGTGRRWRQHDRRDRARTRRRRRRAGCGREPLPERARAARPRGRPRSAERAASAAAAASEPGRAASARRSRRRPRTRPRATARTRPRTRARARGRTELAGRARPRDRGDAESRPRRTGSRAARAGPACGGAPALLEEALASRVQMGGRIGHPCRGAGFRRMSIVSASRRTDMRIRKSRHG